MAGSDPGVEGRLQPGTDFGSFRILELIGAGGMGEVYLVKRAHIDRLDALKVLNSNADGTTATRFLREMELAARLQHPHVVAVHDVGQVESASPSDGAVTRQPWILMQYIAGKSLRQHMEAAAPLPLPVDRTVRLLTQVADGLDAAHRLGIVHRDVKPENVLVYGDPSGREHAYVADLGIAEALDAANRLTGVSGNLGTPGYMSPERFFGSSELDARADVYGLACMAFEMLSTKLPRDIAPGFTELPSLTRTRPGFGADADAVLKKALALRPEDRYASCPDFLAALATALATGAATGTAAVAATSPAAATPPSAVEQAGVTVAAGAPTASAPADRVPGGRAWSSRLLPVGAALAALAVVGVGALQLTGDEDKGQQTGLRVSPSASTPTSARPSVSPAPAAHQWIDAVGPDADQQVLLSQLPTFFADTGRCGRPPADDPRDIVPPARANVMCTYLGGSIVVFSLFDSDATMSSFFNERLAGRGLTAGEGTPGPTAPWAHDYAGDPVRGTGRIYAKVNPNRPQDKVRSEIGWIRQGTSMYGYAFRPNADFAGMYSWWSGLFQGPVATA